MNDEKNFILPINTQRYVSKSDNLYLNMYTYSFLEGKNKIRTTFDEEIERKRQKRDNKKTYASKEREVQLLKKINDQMMIIAGTYTGSVVQFTFKPDRLIIGNSGGNYGNTAIIAVHPTYCIPYIPSSAIKGAFRSFMIYTEYQGNEQKAIRCKRFRDIFGAPDAEKEEEQKSIDGQRGNVIFLDAFPKDKYYIEQDIQTVHYNHYYNNGKAQPTDDMNRKPINMYIVANTTFAINAIFLDHYFSSEEREKIKTMFRETFTEFGIGAKTAIGYGLGEIQ